MDLRNLEIRTERISIRDIFPRFDRKDARIALKRPLPRLSVHEVVATLAMLIWEDYKYILERYGFHDHACREASGHCHQLSPALAMLLELYDIPAAYIEGYRVHGPEGSAIVSPEEEVDDAKRREYVPLNRIPYCCVRVRIEGKEYYISPKHYKVMVDGLRCQPVLTSECYRDAVGPIRHPERYDRSGIYLQPLSLNPLVWAKQGPADKTPEYFLGYATMLLDLG